MPIRAKSFFVKNNLPTYIKQRFNVLIFAALSFYMILFAKNLQLEWVTFIKDFSFLMFAFFSLRLYDDLQQWEIDFEKPNRNYTEANTRRSLISYVIILFLITGALGALISNRIAIGFITFVILNHLLYFFLLKKGKFHTLLPLVKYPILLYLLLISNTESSTSIIIQNWQIILSLFFAFIRMESMNDEAFILNSRQTILFNLISFALLLQGHLNDKTLILCVSANSITFIPEYFRFKGKDYFYLLTLLTFKLLLYYYAI